MIIYLKMFWHHSTNFQEFKNGYNVVSHILCPSGVLAGDWSVHLPSGPICAVTGSSLVLPCSYDYPQSSNETRAEEQLSTQVIE